jgi:16S rRNA (cytosine1402-N4)-methyltransferase
LDALHAPVLRAESVAYLDVGRGGLFVDVTVGLGGHAEAVLAASPAARVLGLDRDPEALELARRRLAPFGARVALELGDFRDLAARVGPDRPVAGVLADLGVSSLQLDRGERGFSFSREGPLDMRMGRGGRTVAELIASSTEGELTDIFRKYGEEPEARRVAKAVAGAAQRGELDSTRALAAVVRRAKRAPRGEERIDPATRVFQALRIAVNDELSALEEMLDQAIRLLERGGRLVVISYHSLEDRIVKNRMRDAARGQVDQVTGRTLSETRVLDVLTKKPVRPTPAEIESNPRSRSARLRAARRL